MRPRTTTEKHEPRMNREKHEPRMNTEEHRKDLSFIPLIRLTAAALVVLTIAPTAARADQTPGPRGRVIVTVVDQSGAVVPDATVTLVGLDETTKSLTISPIKTSDKGIATVENVAPGRYSIEASFPGFELGLLKDTRIRA